MSSVVVSYGAPGLAACLALTLGGCAPHALSASDAAAHRWDRPGVAEAQPEGDDHPRPAQRMDPYGSEARDPHRFRRAMGWISLAIGAEAAVIAVTTSFMLLHQKSVVNGACGAGDRCSPAGLDAAGAIHEIVPWNTATWIVAAAGLGTAAVLLLTSQPEASRIAVGVTPDRGGADVSVMARF